jgi:hypothetical protein
MNVYVLDNGLDKLTVSADSSMLAHTMASAVYGSEWVDAEVIKISDTPSFDGWTLIISIITESPDHPPDHSFTEPGLDSDLSILNMLQRMLPRIQKVFPGAYTNDEFFQLIIPGMGMHEVNVLMVPDHTEINFPFVKEIQHNGSEDLVVTLCNNNEMTPPVIY